MTKLVSEPQKFAGDLIWIAASNLAIPLIGIVTLPALTKNYSAEIYGVWMQTVFFVWLLSFILNLYLGQAAVRFTAAEDDKAVRRRVLGAMLWPIFVFCGVALIVSVLLDKNLSILLFDDTAYANLIPLIFLWAALEAVFTFLTAWLLARRDIRKMSIIQVSLTVYKMVVIVSLAMAGKDLAWIIGCILLGQSIITIVVFWLIVREIGWPWPALEGLKGYLAFSIPLIPSGILFWAISVSDRYFITYFLGLSQSGIYSASFAIGSLIALFYSPIQAALFPVLSRLWEQNEQSKVRNYLEYSNKLFLTLAIPGAAGLYVLSQPLLSILATPDFMAGGGLVILIALATILAGIYQINVYIILLIRQTKWLTPIIAIAAATNIGINVALIPVVGIVGAAISAVVTYLVLAGIILVWARKVIPYRIGIIFMTKVIMGALLMTMCISLIHISGVLGIIVMALAGVIIFSLWMWLVRAFSTEDWKLIKETIMGLKRGALLR